MLSSTDHDKLQQIMQEHPETEELFNRIFIYETVIRRSVFL